MKKLILTLIAVSAVLKLSAQQINKKQVSARDSSIKMMRTTPVEDLIRKLPISTREANVTTIRIDQQDGLSQVKDSTGSKPVHIPTLVELLNKMESLDVDKDGVVKQNGKVVNRVRLISGDTILDTISIKDIPVSKPVKEK